MAVLRPDQIREALLRNTLLQVGSDGSGGLQDGSFSVPHVSVSSNYSASVTKPLILANGTFTVTLPAATGSGSTFWIKNIGTGLVTIDAGSGKKIDGAQTAQLASQYESVQIFDGASNNWYVV
jgi:hypothetical protein